MRGSKTDELGPHWDHKPACTSKVLISRVFLSTLNFQLSTGLWVGRSERRVGRRSAEPYVCMVHTRHSPSRFSSMECGSPCCRFAIFPRRGWRGDAWGVHEGTAPRSVALPRFACPYLSTLSTQHSALSWPPIGGQSAVESRLPRSGWGDNQTPSVAMWASGAVVAQQFYTLLVGGSNPSSPTKSTVNELVNLRGTSDGEGLDSFPPRI